MKLLVMSDLEIPFFRFIPPRAAVSAADAVVLAGDIHFGINAVEWARQAFPGKPVILVAGSHDLYCGHWDRTLDEMREAALRHQVHFLENDAVTVDGIRFLGATLWSDFSLSGQEHVALAMGKPKKRTLDYERITGCTPERVVERNAYSRAWLESELARCEHPRNCVVVTHHFPHKNSTAIEYQRDRSSVVTGSSVKESLFERTALWIHGHTHTSFSYEINGCHVLCNPRGYSTGFTDDDFENRRFNPGLLVERWSDGRWRIAD